jgi:hypothetical protein
MLEGHGFSKARASNHGIMTWLLHLSRHKYNEIIIVKEYLAAGLITWYKGRSCSWMGLYVV